MHGPVLILDNIRSAYNVGAIFRTADAVGVHHIYLIGCTPSPVDRFQRPVKEIAKTALGAERSVPYSVHTDVGLVMSRLRQAHVQIVAVEQVPAAVSIYEYRPVGATAYVFGNEVDGVSSAALHAADDFVAIPMRGQKESLNVSVSVGVTLYVVAAQSVH